MRKFLIVVGAITMLLVTTFIGLLGYAGLHAYGDAKKNKTAAVSAMTQISKNWSLEGREDIVDVSLINQVRSPQTRMAMRKISRLGQLVRTYDIRQTGYKMSNDNGVTSTIATVRFNATFTNGAAKVIAKLRTMNGKTKLIAFRVENGQLKRRRPAQSA